MKNAPRRFGRKSLRNLLQMGKKRRAARHHSSSRRFESLESRLMLHGDNGPHDVDPNYDPTQAFDLHADLAIYVDSELVAIADDIGIDGANFTSFIHTHDGDPNRLHLEPEGAQPTDFVTLGDFFDVWQNNAGSAGNNPNAILTDTQLLDRVVDDNNTLQAYVNGSRLEDHFAHYQIHDGDNIVLTYGNNPVITLDTNAGSVPVLLLRDEAPATVTNYLRYVNGGVDSNGFIGSIFHRNDLGFVLQGGGFRPTSLTTTDIAEIQGAFNPATGDFEHHIPTFNPIPDERMPGDRSNTIGTISMAKNSAGATSEFFYNDGNNFGLDAQGFTVFALALGAATPAGTAVASAPINQIIALTNVDVDPSNNGTGSFSVFDNVPYTADGEMVAFQAIQGEGLVRGMKFNDLDGDGVRDAGEPGLQGFTIFSDANGNGVLDDGEVSDATDVDGDYLLRLAAGPHSIREVPATGFSQTLPQNPDFYSVIVDIGGELTGRDFGNVGVGTPTAVDLVAATDSGVSDSDDQTNFNNSSPATAPQFTVNGVTVGATVELRVDGVLFATQVATTDSVTLTLDGATTISDGPHQISAVQSVGGAFGNSTSLNIAVDSVGPDFTSTAPTTAIADEAYTYNVDTDDEAGVGASYVIVDPTTGAPVPPVVGEPVINPVTGTFGWTPGVGDVGANAFAVRATDQTGNSSTQLFSVDVQEPVVIRFHLDVTKDGQPLSANNLVKTGDQLLLSVFVDDVRTLSNPQDGGVFSAYLDVLYDSSIVSVAGPLTYGDAYTGGRQNNTSVPGIIDMAGAFSGSITPLGQGERLLWSVPLDVIGSGTVTFVGEPTTDPNDPGDVGQTPQFDAGVYNAGDSRFDDPVGPSANPSFGTMQFVNATVNVDARFGIVNIEFQPEEDSADNPISIDDVTNNPLSLNLTFVGTPTAEHGTVTFNSESTELHYTPDADYTGADAISFNVTDGEDTLTGSQSLFVFNLNDPPTAVDDTVDVDEDALEPAFIDVLANDLADPDPDTEKGRFRVDSVQTTSTQGGSVAIAGVGLGVTYLPAADFIGEDTFTYTMSDRDPVDPQFSTATVTVTVKDINDPPTVVADRFGDSPDLIPEDSVDVVLDVMANDSSAPDQDEVISVVAAGFTQPLNGTVTLSSSGDVLYTPNPDFFGEDTFTYTITDDDPVDPRTASTSVVVVVSPGNDAPTANDDTGLTVTQDTSQNTLDLLGNDSFVPDTGETLTITGVSNVTAGATVEIASDGLSVRYTPVAGFLGADTFTYTISDGNGGTDTATATIEVVEFMPGSLSGFVYVDANDNGVRETTERLLDGVTITLTGTDLFGAVNRTTQTAADGSYSFGSLAPGDFVITQTQPAEDLDGDGIPLLDGKDTPGSQGGVAGKDAQGNDIFTVTLAEGVDGTDNNFGEIKGRTINVLLGASGDGLLFEFDVRLIEDGQAVRPVERTDFNSQANFLGVLPGAYQVQVSGPFLLNGAADVVVGDQGAVVTVGIGEPAIDPVYPTYLDSLSSRSSSFANVAVGLAEQHWLALGPEWQDANNVQIRMAAGGDAVSLTIDDAEGTFQGTIPKTNGMLNILNQLPDGTSRIRLNGRPAEFKALLTQVNTNGSGEGEAPPLTGGSPTPTVGFPTSIGGSPTLTGSSPTPTGGQIQTPPPIPQPVFSPPEPVTLTTLDTTRTTSDLSLSSLDVGEGESVNTLIHSTHDVDDHHREDAVDVTIAVLAAPVETTDTGHTLAPVDGDSEELLGALDRAFEELAEGTLVDALGALLVS